jgi:hypothetical protein
MQDNQDREVWIKYREITKTNPAGGMNICVVCCTGKVKAQSGTMESKKQVREKYEERARE